MYIFVVMEKINPVVGRKVDKSTLINLERGKIPPQSVDLEEVVLGGAMMIDKKGGVDEVIDILHPDVFIKMPIAISMRLYLSCLKDQNRLIY